MDVLDKPEEASFQRWLEAGGGWVADSIPENEFQETINKSKAMVKALTLAESIGRQ